jgi:hypothetical protein
MLEVSHTTLLIVLTVSYAIQVGGLVILGLILYASRRESHRMDTALGALIIQEAEKIRQLVATRS